MGRREREKGKRWEREVATRLRALFPGSADQIKRGWQSRQGHGVADIMGVPYLWPECKHHKQPNIRAALRQAEENCPGDKLPIAVCKADRRPPIVAMRLSDWEALVRLLRDSPNEEQADE